MVATKINAIPVIIRFTPIKMPIATNPDSAHSDQIIPPNTIAATPLNSNQIHPLAGRKVKETKIFQMPSQAKHIAKTSVSTVMPISGCARIAPPATTVNTPRMTGEQLGHQTFFSQDLYDLKDSRRQ